MPPLLSICVPTINRANKLKVSLQAMLPQVARFPDDVELWVSDNASPDNTADVVQAARAFGPINYSRNKTNIGFQGNIVKLASQLARGEYVWLIGDDDLLLPNAVGRVLNTLKEHREIDAFYVNFRCAFFETHWPNDALGGYDGPFVTFNDSNLTDRLIPAWKELIRAETYLCTHIYAHVVRRRIWVDYWQGRSIRPEKFTLLSIFPQNVMFADTLMDRPAVYIGQPAITMFHGAQAFIDRFSLVVGLCYPKVLRYFHKKGLSGAQLRECADGVFQRIQPCLVQLLKDNERSRLAVILSFLQTSWPYWPAWKAMITAIRLVDRPWLLSKLIGGLGWLNRLVGRAGIWEGPAIKTQLAAKK